MGAATQDPPATSGRSESEEDLKAKAAAAGSGDGAAADGDGSEKLEGEHGDEQPQPPAIPPLELEGRRKQLSLKISGDAPEKATAKIVGGKIDIPAGEYDPGDVIECVVKLRCTKAGIIDKWNNSTGERVEREREHQFKMLQIEKLDR